MTDRRFVPPPGPEDLMRIGCHRENSWLLRAYVTHICHKLPYFMRSYSLTESGHPFRPSLFDRLVDFGRLISINPGLVDQRRADGASASGAMAAGAVVPGEQAAALLD